ncbi:protein phosphatase 1 regulatory inhibitor subunit 16B isoform 2-T3 [Discoglossus pictus]
MATKPMDLLAELQLLEKASTLERLRAAKKRREQQLKRWAQSEREEEARRRRQQRNRRKTPTRCRRVSFPARVTLHEACLRNDPEEVLSLLQSNVDPNLSNEDGLTALHQCCIDNYEDLLKLLLSHGANVNVTDNELWTPLHAAATCGHTGLVRILIQHGADLLAVNADGHMVYDLCEDEATLDVIENCMTYQGMTQEMVNEARQAPEQLMLSDVTALITAGEDLNQMDSQGATLLHIAASRGFAEVAETLLEHGARVDMRDSDSWEPLHAAAFWGQIYVAEILVSHGASLSSKTSLEETPLDLCEDDELRSLLLELKHKHDLIMKSQQKNKSSLSRRSSSTGSHGLSAVPVCQSGPVCIGGSMRRRPWCGSVWCLPGKLTEDGRKRTAALTYSRGTTWTRSQSQDQTASLNLFSIMASVPLLLPFISLLLSQSPPNPPLLSMEHQTTPCPATPQSLYGAASWTKPPLLCLS